MLVFIHCQHLIFFFQAIRVLGLLGALDPYKHKVFLGQIDSSYDSGAVLSQSDSKQDIDNQGKLVMMCSH